jgi:OmpA-OmpF porin, OOP family
MKYTLCIFLLFFMITGKSQNVVPADNEALLNVIVTDFAKKPRKGDIICFVAQRTGIEYKGISGADGRFSLAVPKGDTYRITYREFSANEEYAEVEIPGGSGKIVSEIAIQLELPKTYVLDNVFFDTGKATLKQESNKALNDLYEVMKFKETLVIEISGHTDNVGGEELNKKLSQDRADAVRAFLLRKGIASNRVKAVGYWFSVPIADNDTDEGRSKNRRTEVRVIEE